MTSPLRMKRRITRLAPTRWMRRAARLLVWSLSMAAAHVSVSIAAAQSSSHPLPPAPPAQAIPTTPIQPAVKATQAYVLEEELGEEQTRPIVRTQAYGRGKTLPEQEVDFAIAIEFPGPERLF